MAEKRALLKQSEYSDADVEVWYVTGGGWLYRAVVDGVALMPDAGVTYVTWQAARANAWQAVDKAVRDGS